MDSCSLLDRYYCALGIEARHVGKTAYAYRPDGSHTPLKADNRYLRLPARFVPRSGSGTQTNSYGEPLWHGIFDGSYTRVGDYIVVDEMVYFIASQHPFLPILCVQTNRVLSIERPNMQTVVALNGYGGLTGMNSTAIVSGWPSSVLSGSTSGSALGGLPTDQSVGGWTILIPAPPGVIFAAGDLVTDDLARSATITATELTELGWRLNAKVAAT